LQHDMPERFLLQLYATSAHGYTRGTWTTPESTNLADRDEPSVSYNSVGINALPIYIKWMLCFEEPESRTLWLGKATPREWLEPATAPIAAANMTSRYGRVSLSLYATASANGDAYSVHANVTLSPRIASMAPVGGLRVRLRVPLAYAGKLSAVSVGGRSWKSFNAAEETVDFAAGDLTAEMVRSGLPAIVASFDGSMHHSF